MSKHTYNNIGRKLYQLRLELGLTQNDVAERCNMSVEFHAVNNLTHFPIHTHIQITFLPHLFE